MFPFSKYRSQRTCYGEAARVQPKILLQRGQGLVLCWNYTMAKTNQRFPLPALVGRRLVFVFHRMAPCFPLRARSAERKASSRHSMIESKFGGLLECTWVSVIAKIT